MTKYLSEKEIEEFFAKDKRKNNDKFLCQNCGEEVSLDIPGSSHRNHCPFCLFSLHVDQNVGDRKSLCKGLMEPIGKFLRPNGEEVIIHKCIECGKFSNNRVLGDDDFGLVGALPIIQEDDK